MYLAVNTVARGVRRGGRRVELKPLNKAGSRATSDARLRETRRTQEERSAHTRQLLIEAAVQILRELGYSHLTISRVADRAGLTNGAMQHHFASREELLVAIIDAVYPVLEIPFADLAPRNRTLEERVGACVDLLWQIYSRAEYLVIWDIAFGTRGDAQLSARLKVYQRDVSKRIRKQLMATFADVGLSAQDTEKIFSTILSCLRGFALQSVFGVDRRRSDIDFVKDIASRTIARSLSRGRERRLR
jgi:AcrR family transcriptional regulator